MKKLMVLGASRYQVPIIKQAQKMGYAVIAVSVEGYYPGFSVADKSYKIDVRDHEEITKIARNEKISGILTDQTDISVPTVAYVARELDLPGIEVECALRFTNKYSMRQYCDRIGIPVPQYAQAPSNKEALALTKNFQFPLILKPVDSQGSRGVIQVNTPDELESAFKDVIIHSSVKQVICEESFQGKEIVIEGFMANNEFTNLVIGDRKYFDLPNIFIPRQTFFHHRLNRNSNKNYLN
jgi:carbamoyl-phosphate synthase large subunit